MRQKGFSFVFHFERLCVLALVSGGVFFSFWALQCASIGLRRIYSLNIFVLMRQFSFQREVSTFWPLRSQNIFYKWNQYVFDTLDFVKR